MSNDDPARAASAAEAGMRQSGFSRPGILMVIGILFTSAFGLILAAAAGAQAPGTTSAEFQYPEIAAPSGPAAGLPCIEIESGGNDLKAGDTLVFPGTFSIASGASVVLEDADGTQGTMIDGENARITEGEGGTIQILLTGAPMNVIGGDEVLSNEVCESIVATTGISGRPETGSGVTPGILPDTGGVVTLLYLGALVLAGAGIAALRRRAGRQDRTR